MSRLKHLLTVSLFALGALSIVPSLTPPQVSKAEASISVPMSAPIDLAKAVPAAAVTKAAAVTPQHKAMVYAKSKIGKPYRYGAIGPNAFDCSGLTMKAYAAAGKKIPRVADAQMRSLHKTTHPRWGDLVFYLDSGGHAYHTAIYVKPGWTLAAPHTGTKVSYRKIYGKHVYRTLR
jgi:cell wall-associated NlpC family hydrolase